MNWLLSSLFLFSCALAFAAQIPDDKSVEARRARFKAALAEEWEYQLRTYPEFATSVGDNRYNDRMTDYSAAAVARDLEHSRVALARFEAINAAGFPEQGRLSRDLMIRNLREQLDGAKFKSWEVPLDQMNGLHISLASLPSYTPFHSVKDYQDYAARLREFPRVLDQVTANLRAGVKDRLVPPRYLLEKVVAQVEDIAQKPPGASPFYQPVKEFSNEIPANRQEALREAVLSAIKQDVAPAYARLAEFLRTEYVPHGRTEPGIWALPGGDAQYRFDVKQMTTTEMTPEDIHQLGIKQVADIEAEMLKIAQSLGYNDLASFNQHVHGDPKRYASSGDQLLNLYKHYVDQMDAKLPELFIQLPKNKLEVMPMEAFRAASGPPADYLIGDGTRPGRINVNEHDPTHRLLLNVESTAYHEGVPGHHLQFSIAQEQTDLPNFRRFTYYNAYSEGWAFYSERLGKEVGFYQDPYSEYGRLEDEMWRSIRLVVDTGVHAQHWSRQQMVDYFHAHSGIDDMTVQTEVDRYIAWPGQALSYKIGQMKIIELRERARHSLGDRFDVRAFHDQVLKDGPLPLDMLEEKIDRWIANQNR